MPSILVLHGPNLNLLGEREPEIYGTTTLAELNAELLIHAAFLDYRISIHQSNAEHELIDWIHAAKTQHDFILFNPAAFTHTSIALRDALSMVKIPFIEIHISDIKNREPFRRLSYFEDIAYQVVNGKGTDGYRIALDIAHQFLLTRGKTL
ncbi:MAG: type II 3-dehydroquinate dehydratase [Gammaproteobacteria bacterium]|nr:type II 3-dehydroquinate dehydratase [Gammaproteobacteria bacterium]MCD8541908.1 type II 3-dehydroquinate dehydratase [Gammaproteobacteria bacterium]